MSHTDDLLTRAINIESAYHVLVGQLKSIENSISDTQSLLNNSKNLLSSKLAELELSSSAIEIVKLLITELSKLGILKLQELLSYGMKSIFFDRDYSIEIVISDRGDLKTAEFILLDNTEGKNLKVSLKDSVGGGIQVIISLILRIYFINILKLRKFIMLDEALKEVSVKYIPSLFDFLNQTVTELGFKYLYISHDEKIVEYASSVYKVRNGIISRLKEDNYA